MATGQSSHVIGQRAPLSPTGPPHRVSSVHSLVPRRTVISSIYVTIVVMLLVFALLIFLALSYYRGNLIQCYETSNIVYCENLQPLVYPYPVYVPARAELYEKPLAQALWSISENVNNANCSQVLPLPNPPGYRSQTVLTGRDPASGLPLMFGYIFHDGMGELTDSVVIAYTGTSNVSEWYDDFDRALVKPIALSSYSKGVEVHQGYYKVYLAIREQLTSQLATLNPATVFVTGHSMGGALATLCAWDLQAAAPRRTYVVYTFGAPRVGDVQFAASVAATVPQLLRVNNTEDIITMIPLPGPLSMASSGSAAKVYCHVGQNLPFTASLGTLVANHTTAYAHYLPEEAEVGSTGGTLSSACPLATTIPIGEQTSHPRLIHRVQRSLLPGETRS